MSFRRRNEPLVARGPAREIPGRPVPVREGREGPDRGLPGRSVQPKKVEKLPNPGVRPSRETSVPTISTGTKDLDWMLIHQGLPLGTSLLVEESGTTDFAAVLLRAFAAQGVIHSRANKSHLHCHVVVVGVSPAWVKDLPGPFKDRKEQKKAKLAQDALRVSVANMAEKDLKIAWRYGVHAKSAESEVVRENAHYTTQFDITQRLVPTASAQEVTFVPVSAGYAAVVAQVERVVETHAKQGKVVRVVMPNFLHPSVYLPEWSQPTQMVPFIHSMRVLLAKHADMALIMSLPLDLYPRGSFLAHKLETLMDSVYQLRPFDAHTASLVERAHKNEPSKIQHGFVNIIKTTYFSDKGANMSANCTYAFKNGRKRFEIEDWSIPVDDFEPELDKTEF